MTNNLKFALISVGSDALACISHRLSHVTLSSLNSKRNGPELDLLRSFASLIGSSAATSETLHNRKQANFALRPDQACGSVSQGVRTDYATT